MRLLLIVGVLGMIGAGCRTRPPVNTYHSSVQPGLTVDKDLARDLSVDEVTSSYLGELLQVQSIVTNRTKKQIPFEYRVEWFDAQGMLVETPASRWTIRHIYGGEAMPLTVVAPSPQVTRWTLKLKRRL